MTDNRKSSVLLVTVLVVHAILLISPLTYSAGFRASLVVPVTTVLLAVTLACRRQRISESILLVVLASLVTSCVAGLYWESWRAALMPAYLGISMLAASIASIKDFRLLTSVSSAVLLVMLIGAWIAVILAFNGFPPLAEVSGLNSRRLYVYYTSLTPTVLGNFIRPAGIYDEPGALSLVTCVIAFLRSQMGMDKRYSWLLLSLGFVTFSLAHVVYVVLHFLAERRIIAAWRNLLIVSCLAFVVLSATGLWTYFDERLIARLAISTDPQELIEGDNRSGYLFRAMETMLRASSQQFLFGIDISCIEGTAVCRQDFPVLGFNPLAPLAYYGILISWPYYVFLAITIGFGVSRRRWWPLMAVGLLYAQRPNLFAAGYAMLAAAALVVFFRQGNLSMYDQILVRARISGRAWDILTNRTTWRGMLVKPSAEQYAVSRTNDLP